VTSALTVPPLDRASQLTSVRLPSLPGFAQEPCLAVNPDLSIAGSLFLLEYGPLLDEGQSTLVSHLVALPLQHP